MTDQPLTVTFLGTGTSTGVPVIACDCKVCRSTDKRDSRLRTSVFVQSGDTRVVIDCGPDFRMQMLRQKVKNIDAIVFTHSHRDHVAGLDDIRAFNFILNKSIEVYGKQEVIEDIKTQFPYVFNSNGYLGTPQLTTHIISDKPFTVNEVCFIPINVEHGPSGIFGYRISYFAYITDASYIQKEELKKVYGSKVLVINALRHSRHSSHYSLPEAIAIIKELQPEKAYLTHISHFLGLHEEVQKRLPENLFLAYDGLKIKI